MTYTYTSAREVAVKVDEFSPVVRPCCGGTDVFGCSEDSATETQRT